MKFNRVFAIVLRQFYLMKGSISRIMPLFVWATIDIVLWGFITKYLNTLSSGDLNFVPMLLGAVLMWDFFIRIMQGVSMTFLEDVWTKNFLNIFAAPVSVFEYIAGLVLTSLLTGVVGLLVMLLLASVFFGLSFFIYGLAFFLFLLVLILFGISLGILACAMVLRLGPPAEWFIWPIPAIISPFAGVFYPISTLPEWMQFISYTLPPSCVFEGMRAIIMGRPFSGILLLEGAGLAVFYVLLSLWTFARVYRHALRSGLIARYSAESMS